ncbi:MAG TPA: vitamin K epoxide reductase family protein [Candidatus Dormibacteraeota bacterium]|nr:vitamin K epoxide reductase family protein [Candidatus Dormibacteraeota bacterium]
MGRLQLTALIASAAGVLVSVYLTVLHYAGTVPGCPATSTINCEAVLSSPYAVLFGTSLPTSAAGIVWFAYSTFLWTRRFGIVQVAWSAVGMVAVLYLVFLEIVKLGAICLWCTGAHVLVLVIFLVAVTLRGRD